jgi:Flp pilus assembly pilin Flp
MVILGRTAAMMDSLRTLRHRIVRDDRGAGLIEYCLLVALIALVCFGAITYFGSESANSTTTSCERIATATGDDPGDC